MWDEFFAEKTDVRLDDDGSHVFRVYRSAAPAAQGPLLVLLHGGGYSALTWSHFTVGGSDGTERNGKEQLTNVCLSFRRKSRSPFTASAWRSICAATATRW